MQITVFDRKIHSKPAKYMIHSHLPIICHKIIINYLFNNKFLAKNCTPTRIYHILLLVMCIFTRNIALLNN